MGAEYTKAQAAASEKYMKDKHVIRVVTTKEKAEEYKRRAKEEGFSSLNKFIIAKIEGEA